MGFPIVNLETLTHSTLYKTFLSFYLILGINFQSYGQTTLEEQAEELTQYLDNWHNKETGLWETTSWWNAANILTALINNARLTNDPNFKLKIAEIYQKTKEFEVAATDEKAAWVCKDYINDFYDDEGWWALAWLDAWEFTGEQKYLDMANIIFDDIITGWSDRGGLYWKKGLDYRGSISNGLAMTLATRLHLAGTGTVHGKSALLWATSIWDWMIDSQLLDSNGNIQDGIRFKNGQESIRENIYTYNQGVVLTGLVNLYNITGEGHYLESAHNLVLATLENMTNSDFVLVEKICEPDKCNPDAKQFKGVFMRHLMYLNDHSPREAYEDFILRNVKKLWKKAMENGTKAPGVVWDKPSEANAATVSSALDAFNAALSLQE